MSNVQEPTTSPTPKKLSTWRPKIATVLLGALLGAWITWIDRNDSRFPAVSGQFWLSSLFAFANLLTLWTVYSRNTLWAVRVIFTGGCIARFCHLIMNHEIADDNLYWSYELCVESFLIFLILGIERAIREPNFSILSILAATVTTALAIALIRHFDFSLWKVYERYTVPPNMSAFMIANSVTSIAIVTAIGLLAFSPIHLAIRIGLLAFVSIAGPIWIYVSYGWYGGPEEWRRATTISPLLDGVIVGVTLILIRKRHKIFGTDNPTAI